jgi:hypothetical protein
VDDEDGLYSLLAEPFAGYYTAEGVFGPFLSGEQITSRLNDVLGVGLWQFHIVQFSVDQVADEVIALGELRAFIEGQWITRQQFGGQKIKRKKDGVINNLADDHKGAATDAMKKCASLFGVGLYLMVSSATWHQGVPPRQADAARTARPGRPASVPANQAPVRSMAVPAAPAAADDAPAQDRTSSAAADTAPKCMQCDQPLVEAVVPARNGRPAEKWTVNKLRYQGLRRHGMVLCSTHYRAANALVMETG